MSSRGDMEGFHYPTGLPRAARGRFARHFSDSKGVSIQDLPSAAEREAGDPDLVALHAEFRIQNERLATWGREWGVATGDGDLEEDLEHAELKEAIRDVLENVGNIIEESDSLSHAAANSVTPFGGDKKSLARTIEAERKWTVQDRARYEQLADELRTSIDLLYDISKNRRDVHDSNYPDFGASVLGSTGKGKSESSLPLQMSQSASFMSQESCAASEETLVNSASRSSAQRTTISAELPPRLDLSSLEMPDEEPPPYDAAGATPATRLIAHYKLPAPPSQSTEEDGASLHVPVLIEYAPFDSGYRNSEVSVPTNRLDVLMSFYGRCSSLLDYEKYRTLSCLGYFEDPSQARFGLVYELPRTALNLEKLNGSSIDSRPVSLHRVLQQASRSLNPNRQPPPGPPLEDRYRLAFNLVQGFAKMHIEEELVHKDVNSSNVIFFLKPANGLSRSHDYDLRAPYVSSFDLFSEFGIEQIQATAGRNLYRHPQDPKVFDGACEFCNKNTCHCAKFRFDVYGLGLVLLEIGLWEPLSDFYKRKYSLEDFKRRLETVWVRKLASRCGTMYQTVVKECLRQAGQNSSNEQMRANYERWLRKLRRCCLIDEEEAAPSLTATRVPSLLGESTSHSPESTVVLQRSAGVSDNPFLGRQESSATSSGFFYNAFARWTAKKMQVPFSIQEESDKFAGPSNRDFGSSAQISGNLSEVVSPEDFKAAKVIQRAWRRHKQKGAFKRYKEKVVVIQKTWRQKQGRCNAGAKICIESETIKDYHQIKITEHHTSSRPKLKLHAVKLASEILEEWHDYLLPRLERICGRCLRDSPETVSIDLIGVGETALSAKPTIFVTCSSTSRVRSTLSRKFQYDTSIFDLKVRRGRVRRSKAHAPKQRNPPHRSTTNDEDSPSDTAPLNPFHQERPTCGASIGAYIGRKHLPPVSFGGVVNVDSEAYGMTVHHLLDSPSDDESEYEDEREVHAGAERSMASRGVDRYEQFLVGMGGHSTLQSIPTDSMFPLEISDDEEESLDGDVEEHEYSDEDEYLSSSEESEGEEDYTHSTLGDLTGIQPGRGGQILVTQPALDDVAPGFFPSALDKNEDHLASHKFGSIHASSGIRRWTRKSPDGRQITHEIDWALLKLDEQRLQPYNLIQGGRKHLANPQQHDLRRPTFREKLREPVCRGSSFTEQDDEFPVVVAGAEELGNLRVHCLGRTSGLQSGIIGAAMSSVRIYRRRSFSRSWHVIGNFGVGGDSGAWVVDNQFGRVVGHVLAWCGRNAVAYICPMQILLEDMKRTLGAKRICLPGAEEAVTDTVAQAAVAAETVEREKRRPLEEKMELPEFARLDFGDAQRLGLTGGAAEDIMRRSAAKEVMRGMGISGAASAAAAVKSVGAGASAGPRTARIEMRGLVA